MRSANYKDVRDQMQPGDVIAFSGNSLFSAAIKGVTNSPVSHVGILMQGRTLDSGLSTQLIIESAKLKSDFAGVQINRMSFHIAQYEGEIWWLPLSTEARSRLDEEKFFTFLLAQEGKKYDLPQALGSAIDFIPDNEENFNKLYCSELDAGALEAGGVIGPINASEQTPSDVCNFTSNGVIIYDKPTQIKGSPKEIYF